MLLTWQESMKALKQKYKSRIKRQSFLLVAAILSIYVETMLLGAYRKQSHVLTQYKQYIACSTLARNDGNYLGHA